MNDIRDMTINQPGDTAKESTDKGRAADAIVHALEEQILSGSLPDNTPLPSERDLMQQYSASRTVVREAITALSNRGLVENKPRFRPVVRKPGYDTAIDIVSGIVRHLLGQSAGVKNMYDSRVFVERMLVRDAASRASQTDVDKLEAALANNEAAIDNSDKFYLTDTLFHGVLYKIPGNPIFPALHEAYNSWLSPHWAEMRHLPDRNRFNYKNHEVIFNAIVNRDPDAAEIALVRHLAAAWEHVSVTFSEREILPENQ